MEVPIITLEDLAPYAHTFYQHKPRMIKYRHEGITILIFTSLRVRLMGGGETHAAVLRLFLDSLPWPIAVVGTELRLSNMTVTHHLPFCLNLHKLISHHKHFSTELEIFPAAKFLHGGREHVNVFHTGRIVITGVRDINNVENHILPRLLPLLQHALHC